MSYRLNIPKMYVFAALTGFQLWMPIWVVFMQARGLTLGQIGALSSVAWLAIAAAQVPTGVVADTWGRKWSLIAGALCHGFGMFGLLTRVLSPVFLIAFVAWVLSMAFWSGANDALVYDSLRADGLADTFVRVDARWTVVNQAASVLAGLASALLARYDLRWCFIVTGVACLAATLVGLTFAEPPRSEHAVSVRLGYRDNLVNGLRIALQQPRVRYLALLGAIVTLFPTLLMLTMVQPYAREVGVPVWELGLLYVGIRATSVVGSLAAPYAATRVGGAALIVVGPLLMSGLLIALWLTASPLGLVGIALFAIAYYVVRPSLFALLQASTPSAFRATILSAQSLVLTLMLAAIEPALFAVGGRTSMALAVGLAGMLMALMAGPTLLLLHRAHSAGALSSVDLA
jgi:hypothetical protein